VEGVTDPHRALWDDRPIHPDSARSPSLRLLDVGAALLAGSAPSEPIPIAATEPSAEPVPRRLRVPSPARERGSVAPNRTGLPLVQPVAT
jgi:hypothetical protein